MTTPGAFPMQNPWIANLPGPKMRAWIEKNGASACERYYTDDPYFALWMHYVDKACRRRVLVSCHDLEDWMYRDAYDDGLSPQEACVDMLAANGYEGAYEE